MIDSTALATAIENASKVANTPLFTTIIDKITGFKISQWNAEGEVRKKIIHDEYEKAKGNGIVGMQYIENLRRTTNLIDTAVKSSKYIDQGKSNDIKIDNDFFWNTIEYAKTISNDEIQELIAKIIADEYNKPDSYTMSTLQTLKMLGKKELELFERMCSFCINREQIPRNVFSIPDELDDILKSIGIDFGSLLTLQNLGLFLPGEMSSIIKTPVNKIYTLSYFDRQVKFKLIDETNPKIVIPGFYSLSNTGKQIIQHLNPKFIDDYYIWIKANYKINNFEIIEI